MGLGGPLIAEKPVLARDRHLMQFITLEDETGLVEAVVLPNTFRKRGSTNTIGEETPASGVAELQYGICIMRWPPDSGEQPQAPRLPSTSRKTGEMEAR